MASSQNENLISSLSCSNAACHGSLEAEHATGSIRFDEYHVWTLDPHRQAFETLHGDQSLRILGNLGLLDGQGDVVSGQEQRFEAAWENCCHCHDTPMDEQVSVEKTAWLAEGVSCTACHGSAKRWVNLHFRPQWKQLSPDKKAAFGYRNLDDLTVQARVCSSCHVGKSGGDVNHDLIAAGHPAMRFEFVWYHHRLPRHWSSARRQTTSRPSADSSSAWLIGQMAAADASLRQLQRRAQLTIGQQDTHVWPELAEYGCFACHHDLDAAPLWRPLQGLSKKRVGLGKVQIPWESWELQLVPHLATAFDTSRSREFDQAFTKLYASMASGLTPSAGDIVELAEETAHALGGWGEEAESATDEQVLRMLSSMVLDHEPEWCVATWDRSAHLFFGLAAPHRGKQSTIPSELFQLRDLLRFPVTDEAEFLSPGQFVGPITEESQPDENIRYEVMRRIHHLVPDDR